MKQRLDAIFFDLDGTLLPMNLDAFTHGYFHLLAEYFAPRGLDADALLRAVMLGTQRMVENDGAASNSERFWECFNQVMGENACGLVADFDAFYTRDFEKAHAFTSPNPLAAQAVAAARTKAPLVVLATNPLFPACGVRTRLSWVGLSPEDFDYVTTYENASYCKPNPRYYEQILNRLSLSGKRVLMIGNDVREDAQPASAVGLETYLVRDCLLTHGLDASLYPQGSFSDLLKLLTEH